MNKSEVPIPIEDAAASLGVTEGQIYRWVEVDRTELLRNHRGLLSVTKSYVTACSGRPDYSSALMNSIRAENEEKERQSDWGDIDRLSRSKSAVIDQYVRWIAELSTVHKRYVQEINRKGNESWEFAAYLLLSRAIALANAGCEMLRQDYWYSGSLLREIDETLDVARYFKICSEKGDTRDLIAWFRRGVAPSHSKCRKTIASWASEIAPEVGNTEYLLYELYQKKSKWVHPTFTTIREASDFEVVNGQLRIRNLCYGKCQHQSKLIELIEFFRSSIWTLYQIFLILFIDIVSKEDREKIMAFDKLQQQL